MPALVFDRSIGEYRQRTPIRNDRFDDEAPWYQYEDDILGIDRKMPEDAPLDGDQVASLIDIYEWDGVLDPAEWTDLEASRPDLFSNVVIVEEVQDAS